MNKWIGVGDFKIGDEEKKAINDVLDSGRISEGERVREFENSFARYVGTKHAIALSSGTAALISGLNAVKAKFGIKLHQRGEPPKGKPQAGGDEDVIDADFEVKDDGGECRASPLEESTPCAGAHDREGM